GGDGVRPDHGQLHRRRGHHRGGLRLARYRFVDDRLHHQPRLRGGPGLDRPPRRLLHRDQPARGHRARLPRPAHNPGERVMTAETSERTGRVHRRTVVAASILVFFAALALVGPFLYPYDAVATSPVDRLLPPGSRLEDGSLALL